MFKPVFVWGLFAAGALPAAGCGSSMVDPDPTTQLVAVSPPGGATGVAPAANPQFTFSRPMMAGMEQYVALHRGNLTGPIVPMTCEWSGGRTILACRPELPLEAATRYTLHLGGGMIDAGGRRVGMDQSGTAMGGRWATDSMMGGQNGMMGQGWTHPNGSYGMAFEFMTQ